MYLHGAGRVDLQGIVRVIETIGAPVFFDGVFSVFQECFKS